MTDIKSNPHHDRYTDAREREAALDEALAESFPASDSPSLARSGERRPAWLAPSTVADEFVAFDAKPVARE